MDDRNKAGRKNGNVRGKQRKTPEKRWISVEWKDSPNEEGDESILPAEVLFLRSDRTTVSLEVRPDLQVWVRAPRQMREAEAVSFLYRHKEWLSAHLAAQAGRRQEQTEPDPEEIRRYRRQAELVIPERVRYFARHMGVDYGTIRIKAQKTRYGSCSSRGNLNFNWKLIRMPAEVLDYVVVHELAHRKQMNHSSLFWREVEQVPPDYRERRRWLKEHGG